MDASSFSSDEILISIIIPFLNESAVIEDLFLNITQTFPVNSFLEENKKVSYEVIFVDGGSRDNTSDKIRNIFGENKNHEIISSAKGRSIQMNTGAKQAKGQCLLFLHADTRLPDKSMDLLTTFCQQHEKSWGSFSIKFDDEHLAFRLLARMINWRSELTRVVTGDQAIFVKQETFHSLGGFPEIPLMEDVAFTKRLKKCSAPYRIKQAATTSSRRWKSKGLLRTIGLMWFLRFAYVIGVSPGRLASWYYPND